MSDLKEKVIEDSNGLTEEQKTKILTACNAPGKPPSLKELCILVFGPGSDGRDKRARWVKEFCGQMGKEFSVSYVYNKVTEEINFTDDQKEFIKNHSNEMNSLEIARVLWGDVTLTPLDSRCRAVRRQLDELAVYNPKTDDDLAVEDYTPPHTILQAAIKVNLYVRDALPKDVIEKDTRVRKNLDCLVRFCHNPRYLSLINSIQNNLDRTLFESSFIRYLYNIGDDLSEMDLDAYISLCLEVVNRTKLQRELEKLNDCRDNSVDSDQRLGIAVVQMIGEIHKAIDNNEKRQSVLRNSLEGTRSKRMEQKLQANASVIQLVDAWRNEEKRKRMLNLAKLRREKVAKSIEQLDTMDAIKVEIFGQDREAF